MKKNMILAIVIATFFSCTEVLDEISITDEGKDLIVDSLNIVKEDTVVNDTINKDKINPETILDVDDEKLIRLGLHFTNKELELWKERSQIGPYNYSGDSDLGSFSPGDFQRISSNANSFIKNPSSDRVQWPIQTIVWGSYEPRKNHIKLRDAAFMYLLTGDTKYSDPVIKELLAQASEPSLDFNNNAVWGDIRAGNPYFDITIWMTRLLYSYDYIKDQLTESENEKLKSWFLKGAKKFQHFIDDSYSNIWKSRNDGNYIPTSNGSQFRTYTHDNGYKVHTVNLWYHNRRSAMVMFYGLTGVAFNNYDLKLSAKKHVKEYLMFGIYPSGLPVELHRSFDDKKRPEAGYGYSANTLDYVIQIADAFARSGDTELYDYTTSDGFHESKGGNKNIYLVMKTMADLLNGNYFDPKTNSSKIYISSNHTESNLIDGRLGSEVYGRLMWYAQANLYYNNEWFKHSYLNLIQESGNNITSTAGLDPFSGAVNIVPGKLFMWGECEGKVWPYVSSNE